MPAINPEETTIEVWLDSTALAEVLAYPRMRTSSQRFLRNTIVKACGSYGETIDETRNCLDESDNLRVLRIVWHFNLEAVYGAKIAERGHVLCRYVVARGKQLRRRLDRYAAEKHFAMACVGVKIDIAPEAAERVLGIIERPAMWPPDQTLRVPCCNVLGPRHAERDGSA